MKITKIILASTLFVSPISLSAEDDFIFNSNILNATDIVMVTGTKVAHNYSTTGNCAPGHTSQTSFRSNSKWCTH